MWASVKSAYTRKSCVRVDVTDLKIISGFKKIPVDKVKFVVVSFFYLSSSGEKR